MLTRRIDVLMALSPLRKSLVAACAGAIAALGQAPFDLWPLTLIGLAVVHLMASALPRPLQVARLWWAAGAGYFAVALSWIVEPFLVDIQTHGWMAPFALIFMAAGMALFWGAAGGLARFVAAGRGFRFALATTLTFVLIGYLRGLVFTGFPWALPGHVLISTPAVQWAQWMGAMGLGALIFLFATSLPLIWAAPLKRGLAWCAALAVVMAGGALLTPPTADLTGRPIIRIVQPNVPQHEKWDRMLAPQHFDRTLSLTAQGIDPANPPALVVWPETSVPAWLEEVPHLMPTLSQAASGQPMVFGINRGEGQRIFNAMALLGEGGEVRDVYDKHHLVPFGEYIPLGDLLGDLGLPGLSQRTGNGFSAGSGPRLMDIPGVGSALPLICYEGVFPRDIAGAPGRPDFLLLITNDAWFGKVSGPYQHLAQARLRAIEQGLPMIRAANTGISALIDPAGRLSGAMPLGTAGVRDLPLPPANLPTPYARIGDLPIAALVLLCLGVLVFGNRRRSAST
ncbi:apolipoprotein N-acyltransferase [Pseudooceanicola sp. MF1-13]|uniref:apolipoprotein N-acyltransferase n=1 Tax=Pseudooceanicola sp. MF1-13 TaxID=3379095 RepID=UPI003892803A